MEVRWRWGHRQYVDGHLRVGARELHHFEVEKPEAGAQHLIDNPAEHSRFDRVRSHEQQRARLNLAHGLLGHVEGVGGHVDD